MQIRGKFSREAASKKATCHQGIRQSQLVYRSEEDPCEI